MTANSPTRTIAWVALGIGIGVLACGRPGRVLESSASAAPAPLEPRDGDAVAIVNGKPISKADLVKILMDIRGVEVLQQMILLETARQATAAKKIKVTAGDIEHEFQDSLDRIAADANITGEDATPENKLKALETMLTSKRLSMSEYRLAIERNAHLRKLVEQDLKITEETLRAEFGRVYGEKRVIRHIQIPVNDDRLLNEALNQIRGGADFAEIARRLSKNPETAERGGEMQPFTFDDSSIPPAMREQAFLMQVGQVSVPIRTEEMFHIIKLEKIIPPESARFEDVRGLVEKSLRTRAMASKMRELADAQLKNAKVKVLDADLKTRYEALLAQNKAADE